MADSIKIKIDGDDSGFKKSLSGLGGVAKKGLGVALKGIAAGAAAGTAALVTLGTQAVKSYADYEQLVGGVETLFKDSADTVKAYADRAYQTAGISANKYMETVTSFSASLLQSLGGDTKAAADMSDMALTDMSDNANKMGTDMEMIIQTYQSLSKGNFAMLDNLKLGYGGTRAELERLIKDASKLDKSVKANDMSFGNMVKAIHAVQTEMGITGTTAKEAATTISGSASAMKAAWQNLLTGMADPTQDFDALIQNFISSVGTFASNLMPVVQNTIQGVLQTIQQLLPQAVSGISQMLPQVMQTLVELVNQIAQSLPGMVQTIVSALPQVVQTIAQALPTLIPALIDGISQSILIIAQVLPQIIQPIIDILPNLIVLVVEAIVNNLPLLIQGLTQLMVYLVVALPQIITALLDAVPTVIGLLVQAIIENIPILINGLMQVTGAIVQAMPQIIESLRSAVGNIPIEIGKVLFDALPEPVQKAFKNALDLAEKTWSKVTSFFEDVCESIKETFEPIGEVLGGFFDKAWNNIQKIWNEVAPFFEGVWNAIQTVFSDVQTFFSEVFDLALAAIQIVWSNASGFFQGVWDSITGVFSTVGSWFGERFAEGWNAVKDAWSYVSTFFDEVWGKIKAAFKTSEFFQVGSDIVQGIINGVTGAAEGLYSSLKNLAKTALQSAKDALGIQSPSRVFREQIGKMIPAGMVIGIRSGAKDVKKAGGYIAKTAIDSVEKPLKIHSPSVYARDEIGMMFTKGIAIGIKAGKYEVAEATQLLFDELQLQRDLDAISEEEYYKQLEFLRDEYITQGTKEWWDYTKELVNHAKETRDALNQEMLGTFETFTDRVSAAYETLADVVTDKLEDIGDKQKDFADTLRDATGGLVQEVTKLDAWGNEIPGYELTDYRKKAAYIEAYGNTLENTGKRLKEAFGEDVAGYNAYMQQIRDDGEEGLQAAYLLQQMSDEELKDHIQGYQYYNSTVDNEAQSQYADEVEAVKRMWTAGTEGLADEFLKEFGELPEGFFDLGTTCAEKFGEAYSKELHSILDNVLVSVSNSMGSVGMKFADAGNPNTTSVSYQPSYYIYATEKASAHEIIKAAKDKEVWAKMEGGY